MRNLLFFFALLSATSCTQRVYWPQGHYHRAAVPAAPTGGAIITVLEEGRDYQGWSPAPVRCQQKPFPFRVSKQ